MPERLTWEQIKEKYPHRNVGLTEIIYKGDSKIIESAVVICTDEIMDRDKMILLGIQGKIIVKYTTFDEDGENV